MSCFLQYATCLPLRSVARACLSKARLHPCSLNVDPICNTLSLQLNFLPWFRHPPSSESMPLNDSAQPMLNIDPVYSCLTSSACHSFRISCRVADSRFSAFSIHTHISYHKFSLN